jgi:cytochrome P450
MYHLTLRIAGQTLFSMDVSGASDAVGDALGVLLERFVKLSAAPVPWPEKWPTPANRRFHRAMATLDRVVYDIIAERRRTGADAPDLLGMFMAARDEETGEGMSDRQLRDEILTMLLAGHETTANTLAWTLHLLATHPEAAAKIQAEVDAQLGDRLPVLEDLRALPYTLQVIKEALRLYPPIWALARRAKADDVIGGCHVPAGAFVFMTQWVTHRDPRFWDEPLAFRPERFAPDRPAPERFVYFPFSQGQRKCIGDRFAEMEAALILPVLVRRFRFRPVPGHPVVPEPSITLRPRHGLLMTLERRA